MEGQGQEGGRKGKKEREREGGWAEMHLAPSLLLPHLGNTYA